MTYNELIEWCPSLDLVLELFKGIAPTIVAILAIVINNSLSRKRESNSQYISRVRIVNSGKIVVLNEMMEKYANLSKMYWLGGSTALEYLGLVKKDKIKEKIIEVKNNMLQIQYMGIEIHDYCYAVISKYNFSFECNDQINYTNKLVEDILDVCDTYSTIFKCEDIDERIKLLDEASEKLKNSTMCAKKEALNKMSKIAEEIKRLSEEV